MNSTIKINDPLIEPKESEKQEIVITKMFADPKKVEMLRKQFKERNNKATDQEIEQLVGNVIAKENAFNHAMMEIDKHFEYSFDSTEIAQRVEKLKTQFPNATPENINKFAQHTIRVELLFNELTMLWGINVSDNDVRDDLEKYYTETNNSIREFLENKDKFEMWRRMIKERKIMDKALSYFKFKFELEKNPSETNKNN